LKEDSTHRKNELVDLQKLYKGFMVKLAEVAGRWRQHKDAPCSEKG
jgi:hypothetical protein